MEPILASFDAEFDDVSRTSRELLSRTPAEVLFKDARHYESTAMCSVGEYLIRSAAVVEQAFGGLTRRLWDDPFEWTLPEKLFDPQEIGRYFDEVDEARRKGMSFISEDADLGRQLPAPAEMRSIARILLEALGLARHYQGRAFALFQIATQNKLPRI